MFAQKYETLKQFEQGWPLAKSEHKGALVVVVVVVVLVGPWARLI